MNQDTPGESTNINEKPSLINVRKLYRYDSSKNALKVYKSKLQEKNQQASLTNEKGDSLEAREPKKRGRKSRIERNLNFLIMDMYKTNDVRAAIKVSENKEFDYSKMFDDFEENNDWEKFRLVKPAEEETKERESSEEAQLFKRKRGRPRSLQRIDGKIRKKMVVNTRESRDVSRESESSEEESKKSSEDEWKESLEKKKPKKADSSFSEENEDAPKKKRGRIPRKLIKNSEREDFEDLRTRRERMLEKRKQEESEESHKKRRERRAKESEEFDDWDKVDSDKKKKRAAEDLKNKENERRRKQEYDMMFNEDYVGEITTKNREHGMVMGSERKKKHESRREEEYEESERIPPMEEESQNDEFVIELEITEEEKSLDENVNNNKKVENYNTPITKPNKKNEREKGMEKEKPKKMTEIVEIDDDDDVQILNPKTEKNIWVNTENDENKIDFDFDHELEDSLE